MTKVREQTTLPEQLENHSKKADESTVNSNDQQNTAEEKDKERKVQADPQITRMFKNLTARYEFRRNRIRQKMEWREVGTEDWNELDDQSEADIVYWLKELGYKKPESDLATILHSSKIGNYNPIRKYTDSLQLKSLGQLQKLMRAVKLDPNIEGEIEGKNYRQLFELYFVKWLMACYKCMTGEKFNDVMLLLVGAQGRHKTSFLNFLCPKGLDDYRHTGHIEPTLNNYLTASYLVEKVWINVDDQMENIFGKDYNSMKSIISQDKVSRRLLYAKHSIQQTRIANFCGSVNEAGFLRDSNNRRYLCFAIEDIDTSYSEVDMDSVWAEVKELAEAAPSKYIFTQDDFRIIDLMDDNFIAPIEENEMLKNCFEPAEGHAQWNYYMQFTEILSVLKKVSGNNGLKSYNLQTAMRKYKYQKLSIRRPERGMMPLQLYTVKLAEGSIYKDILTSYCKDYRWPAEWQGADKVTEEIDGRPF